MNEYKVIHESVITPKSGEKMLCISLDHSPTLAERLCGKILIERAEYTCHFAYDADRLFSVRGFTGSLLGKTVRFNP